MPTTSATSSATTAGSQKWWASLRTIARTRESPDSDPEGSFAEHRAELGDPQRQAPPGPRPGPVDHDVVRAVHRAQHDRAAAAVLDRREHRLGVVLPMPGDFVHGLLAQRR